jgi:N-dimethylarginine dimethylaminohydrolase
MSIIETNNHKILALHAPAPRLAPAGPTTLDKPAFLMNLPFSYETEVANNAWMQELEPEERQVDSRRALRQFFDLYHFMASEGAVYILPTPNGSKLQDLVFTANLGVVLEHIPGRTPVVISNYTTEVRRGESQVGQSFFESMGYEVHLSPHRFEGEAELKHLHDNVYVGGHGIRSELETYRWMERAFDMRIVTIEESDPYLYHLDTMIFPVTREQTMVCTELCDGAELDELE